MAIRQATSMRHIHKLILAAVLGVTAGCSSKLEQQHLVCADFAAAQITLGTAMTRLDLTTEHTQTMDAMTIVDEYCDALD